jgi:hypothetical protein
MAQQPSAAQLQLDIRAASDDPREVVRQLTAAARISAKPAQSAKMVAAKK